MQLTISHNCNLERISTVYRARVARAYMYCGISYRFRDIDAFSSK